MLSHNRKLLLILFVVLCVIAPLRAAAATVQHLSFGATDNATVQGAGPRTGTNGKTFFTLEGSSNGSFASFGVADFDFSTIPPGHLPQAASLVDAQLKLTQNNAFFSVAGPISVYYTPNTAVNIQPGTSPLTDQTGNDGAASVDPLLSPLTLLGSGMFTDTANSTVDSVALSFTGAALPAFLNAFNNGSTLRLIITADAPSTAATYVGIGGGTDPFLSFDYTVVPEPGSGVLAIIPVALFWRLRKRQQPPGTKTRLVPSTQLIC
ncbi:MAG TPA: hypothetical protein VFE46_07975 [Pirellulales bacterium]|nr:hypothetical protein [Pirellulales bacterium]